MPAEPAKPAFERERDPNRVRLQPDGFRVSGDGVFYTLQGEGVTLGCPAVFLRLHVCNLRCGWCDTPYTWNADLDAFWSEPESWSPEECAERIREAWGCADSTVPQRLVVTGGEPLLQREPLDLLLAALCGWTVEIETNGTLMPSPLQLERCLFNCSPKLAHSGNSEQARLRPDVLQALNNARSQFKFVVCGAPDLDEILRDFAPWIDRDRIVLMPEGRNPEEVRTSALAVAEAAKLRGFRLLPRLQIDLWGSRRQT